MELVVNSTVDLNDVNEILASHGLEPGGKIQQFVATELVKEFDPYVPFRTGVLKGSAVRELAPPYDEIVYDTPYAARMYYNPQFNFNGAPMRGAYWDRRAYSDVQDRFLGNVQRFVDSGGGSS